MEQIEKIQGTEKEFIKVFQELCYSRSSWQVWADLMAAMACTLANSVDKTEPRYTARLIEGKYFAYQKMFTEGEINTCASRTALIGAMTRAKMCTEERQPAVFQIEDDVLNISIRDKLADYQEQVPLQETVCKSIRLGFDSKLVLETLKAFTCDNIALGFTSPRTPMIVEAEDSDMKAMVLPVAIREA